MKVDITLHFWQALIDGLLSFERKNDTIYFYLGRARRL
jgi:hypothetical protein